MTESVSIREVGLRDGLQLVKSILPTEIKKQWIDLQSVCGFNEMEVTSFVPPKVVPQFADAAEVLDHAKTIANLNAAVLVPNLKWGLRALDQGASKITFVLSVSEAHNQANVRRSADQSMAECKALIEQRDQQGLANQTDISVALATTFGCSLQGEVSENRVYEVAEFLLDAGIDEMNVADTVGYGNPEQVKRIVGNIMKLTAQIPVACHFHDTRGMGIANAVAALEVGVRRFDASLGGLGGCPFAKGASGNIATEDTVYLMENLGLSTGINIDQMMRVRQQLNDWLKDEPLEGKLLKAGVAKTFQPNQ